jgi:iron complex transport system substrate-binding protein
MPARALPLLLALAALAACADRPPPVAPANPRRVVSLLPAFTEHIVNLGAADRLVGCTEFCRPGRDDVARVPWRDAAAAEAILRLKPDLVLRQTLRRDEDPLKRILTDAGVPVVTFPTEHIEDVERAMVGIGAALGMAPAAERALERFRDAMTRARAGAEGKPSPKVLFVINRDARRAANDSVAGTGGVKDE